MSRAIIIPTLIARGAERMASELSMNLSRNPYLVVFDGSQIDLSYKGELIDLGIRTIRNRKSLVRFLDTMRAIFRLRRVKKDLHIDLTISLLELANIPNILSGFSKKNIISVLEYRHECEDENLQRKLANLAIRFLYNRADRISVCSQGVKYNLLRDFKLRPEKVEVIYTPIDIDRIEELKKEPIEEKYREIFSHPVIITLGGLEKRKGQWHLIRAFKEAKKKLKDAKLVIIGKEGGLEKYLERLAKDMGIGNDVFVLGFQENPFKYIAASSLFVFPSLREGFGIVLVEAMVCNVPIISTDCRIGPREVLAPDTEFMHETNDAEFAKHGVLVPVCDGKFKNAGDPLAHEEKIMANAIVELMENSDLRQTYSQYARERANDFHVAKIIRQWENMIDNVAHGKGRAPA